MMIKIGMKTPIVEMDGDEMAHVLWNLTKEKLLYPYVELMCQASELSSYRNK